MNRLAFRDGDRFAGNANALARAADEMHFDALLVRLVEGVMRKCVNIEIRVEFAIGAGENVFVESGGDAGPVVVGRMQDGRVFHEIYAD